MNKMLLNVMHVLESTHAFGWQITQVGKKDGAGAEQHNNPRARITIEEATQPEKGHFIGVAKI
jgi:hypothetical protein